jgi:aldose 1-epimerase
MNTIKQISFLGEEAISAENEKLRMTIVPGWGSHLISLYSKEADCECLRVPKTAAEYHRIPVLYGVPILFPPNRIEDGIFSFKGRKYQLELNELKYHNHIHGFLYKEKWDLVRAEIVDGRVLVETEIHSSMRPHIYGQFPHLFTIKMTYVLHGETLSQTATIISHDKEEFPWGLGYHTTFLFPIGPDSSPEDCSLSLSVDKRWKLNQRMLPTGELEEFPEREQLRQGVSLQGWIQDDVYLSSVQQDGENQAVIIDHKLGLKVVYQCDAIFKHWVLYNGDGKQGFVCPEPYTWVTNAPNLQLPASLTGIQVLSSGESVQAKSKFVVTSFSS